jgi:hypothetical protein
MNAITDLAKEAVGYEGLYTVTKFGVVYSLPRKHRRKLRIMKPTKNSSDGYLRVGLTNDGGYHLVCVHRLVALAYIPNPLNKPMVNHLNGIKTDNRLENLEWVTGQENRDHAFSIGLYPNQKIPSHMKGEVYELVQKRVPIKTVAEMYGMKPRGVTTLVRRYREAEIKMAA